MFVDVTFSGGGSGVCCRCSRESRWGDRRPSASDGCGDVFAGLRGWPRGASPRKRPRGREDGVAVAAAADEATGRGRAGGHMGASSQTRLRWGGEAGPSPPWTRPRGRTWEMSPRTRPQGGEEARGENTAADEVSGRPWGTDVASADKATRAFFGNVVAAAATAARKRSARRRAVGDFASTEGRERKARPAGAKKASEGHGDHRLCEQFRGRPPGMSSQRRLPGGGKAWGRRHGRVAPMDNAARTALARVIANEAAYEAAGRPPRSLPLWKNPRCWPWGMPFRTRPLRKGNQKRRPLPKTRSQDATGGSRTRRREPRVRLLAMSLWTRSRGG